MKALRVTVGTTPTLLVKGDQTNGAGDPMSALLQTAAGAVNVALGGPDVTFATGYVMTAQTPVSVDMVNESLYGIVNSGTEVVQVLRKGGN